MYLCVDSFEESVDISIGHFEYWTLLVHQFRHVCLIKDICWSFRSSNIPCLMKITSIRFILYWDGGFPPYFFIGNVVFLFNRDRFLRHVIADFFPKRGCIVVHFCRCLWNLSEHIRIYRILKINNRHRRVTYRGTWRRTGVHGGAWGNIGVQG